MFLQIQTAAADTAAALPEVKTLSIMELITSGGVGGTLIMGVLFTLSLLTIYLFIERNRLIGRASKLDENFMNRIKEHVLNGKMDAALDLCRGNESPVARMIEKGLGRIGKPLKDISAAIENTAKLEVYRMEQNLATLATVSGAAPMIGFLGTVIGMILAFHEMASAGGQIDVEMLAEGIYTAMTTTVAGLIVGIMGYVGYNYLVHRVDKVVYRMEANTTEFMDLLNDPSN